MKPVEKREEKTKPEQGSEKDDYSYFETRLSKLLDFGADNHPPQTEQQT
jgi:hypothetical protein